MSLYEKREALLISLSETISPEQFSKLTALLDSQERLCNAIIDRNKAIRRLRKFLEPKEFRLACLALDLTEEMVYGVRDKGKQSDLDYLTILEHRAFVACQAHESFKWEDWLAPEDMLDFMQLENAECKAFGTQQPWSLENIQQFKTKHNL